MHKKDLYIKYLLSARKSQLKIDRNSQNRVFSDDG